MSHIRKHLLIWLILVPFFILISLLYNFSVVDQEIWKERKGVELAFGANVEKRVMDRSLAVYNFCFADIAKWMEEFYRTDNETLQKGTSVFIQNIFGTIFQVILRLMVLCEWLYWVWPIIAILIHDAFITRRIRSESLTWQSPIRNFLGIHGVIVSLGLMLAYLFFPFTLTIYIVPVWLAVFSVFFYMAVSNMQRMI